MGLATSFELELFWQRTTQSDLQIKGHVTGYGQPTWYATHEPAIHTSPAVQVQDHIQDTSHRPNTTGAPERKLRMYVRVALAPEG